MADGVVLPITTKTSLFCSNTRAFDEALLDVDEDWASISGPKELCSPAPDGLNADFDFTDLDKIVGTAIALLGGNVFPKLNWSAPQDASWMNMGSLKCQQPGDVYLLLKSSDFCSHDLNHPFDGCVELTPPDAAFVNYTIVLRKWQQLRPERSFRCFVRDRHLVAISQRDCSAHYPQLEKEAQFIQQAITAFLGSSGRSDTLKPRLLDRFLDPNVAADVYVDKDRRVWLVDVNVWGGCTDSLLFAWGEPPLGGQEHLDRPVQIRLVDNEQLRPAKFASYRAPLEMHRFAEGLASGGASETPASDQYDFGKFFKAVSEGRADDDSDE
jgi:hypothetical protein